MQELERLKQLCTDKDQQLKQQEQRIQQQVQKQFDSVLEHKNKEITDLRSSWLLEQELSKKQLFEQEKRLKLEFERELSEHRQRWNSEKDDLAARDTENLNRVKQDHQR